MAAELSWHQSCRRRWAGSSCVWWSGSLQRFIKLADDYMSVLLLFSKCTGSILGWWRK